MPQCLDSPSAGPVGMRLTVDGGDRAGVRASLESMGLGRILIRISEADDPARVSGMIGLGRALAAEGVGVAVQVQQKPSFCGGDAVAFAERVLSGLGFTPDWICVGQGVNSLEWGMRSAADRDRLVEASAHFVRNRPGAGLRVAAAAIESPIMQAGCGNIARLLGMNVRYKALTFVWGDGCPPLADELKTLRALAAGSFYARQRAIVIAETPPDRLGDIQSFSGFAEEICVCGGGRLRHPAP